MEVKSPCIGVCAYEESERVCRGCGRTDKEIEEWIYATEGRKKEIIKACEDRKKK
jgi:hypothetical protein